MTFFGNFLERVGKELNISMPTVCSYSYESAVIRSREHFKRIVIRRVVGCFEIERARILLLESLSFLKRSQL